MLCSDKPSPCKGGQRYIMKKAVLSIKKLLRLDALKSYLPALLAAFTLLFGGNILNPQFSSIKNVGSLLSMASIIAIAAAAQTFVVLIGGESIDLSIGPVMSLTALMIPHLTKGDNGMLVPMILFLVLLGAFIGFVNGFCSQIIKIPPLIMTMIMGTVVNGLTFAWTRGMPSLTIPKNLLFMKRQFIGSFSGIVFAVIMIVIITEFVLRKTRYGKSLYLIGSNRNASLLSGISINKNVVLAYLISGTIAALGGILTIGFLGIGNIKICESYTMYSVAAIAIGGANMQGGRGTILGALIGAIVLQLLSSVLVAAGWNQGIRQLIQGVVLLLILIAIFLKSAKQLQQ